MINDGVKGFTEWTIIEKAKPLFKVQYQACVPADFYVIQSAQSAILMDTLCGIDGFAYWPNIGWNKENIF
jgi:hypothetical protein